MNLTLTDFVIFPIFENVAVANVQVLEDQIDLGQHDFDQTFNGILSSLKTEWNDEYQKGWPLSNIDPRLSMITGLIKNSTLSPYVADGWLYGGFSMQADLPTDPHTLEFVQF